MRIDIEQLKTFLSDSGLMPKDQIEAVATEAKGDGAAMGKLILDKKLLSEAEMQKMYAYLLGYPFVDLTKETIPLEILQIVPGPIAKKYNIVSFEKSGQNLKVAMLNPEDLQTIDFIKKK